MAALGGRLAGEQRMEALVKAASSPGLELTDVPVPPIGRDEVLIRILKTAICGADVHIYQRDEWRGARCRCRWSSARSSSA